MKKIITISILILLASCGRTNYKKSKTGILGPNSTACQQSEVCNVTLTNKSPVAFTFKVNKTGNDQYYDAYRYDTSGERIAYISEIFCSADAHCYLADNDNLNVATQVGNQYEVSVNLNGVGIPAQHTIKVFKR